jgi:hypothetical protein
MLSESVDPSFTEQAQSPLSSLDLHPCATLEYVDRACIIALLQLPELSMMLVVWWVRDGFVADDFCSGTRGRIFILEIRSLASKSRERRDGCLSSSLPSRAFDSFFVQFCQHFSTS